MRVDDPPASRTPYDDVPYYSLPFPQAHVERLAARAYFLGASPPAIEFSRVLELGCSSGGHLIPMADLLPEATFVGIDLSSEQIAAGSRRVADLELRNIELRHMSIADIGPELGQFDYILAHGVYSWVPPEVREHLLTVCKTNLAPDGVAYISYNTLPGCSARLQLRRMMQFHVRRWTDPAKQVEQGWALLRMLRDGTSENSPYGCTIRGIFEALAEQNQAYFLHDFLAPINDGFFLHEFADAAKRHGLRYLCDSELSTLDTSGYREVVDDLPEVTGDPVCFEQYLDFLSNRGFRRSLLVHDHVRLHRDVAGAANVDLRPLFFGLLATPRTHCPDSQGKIVYKTLTGDLSIKGDILNTALLELTHHPERLGRDDLANRVGQHLGRPLSDVDADRLISRLTTLAVVSAVDVGFCQWPGTRNPASRPEASRIARYQALAGDRTVASLRHQSVALDDLDRLLLPRLNGQRTHDQLLDALKRDVEDGNLTVQETGQLGRQIDQRREQETALQGLIADRLAKYAERGLLVR